MPFCPNCGKAVNAEDAFCLSCGYSLKAVSIPKPQHAVPLEHKSPGTANRIEVVLYPFHIVGRKSPRTAAVLALLPGLFGVMGMGHAYLGRVWRGAIFLMAGIILSLLTWGSIALGLMGVLPNVLWIIFAIIFFILWIWQAYDAYNLTKQFQ